MKVLAIVFSGVLSVLASGCIGNDLGGVCSSGETCECNGIGNCTKS
ncbi:MAG: hypothetical protein JRH11_20235, partial [Deltaproteobacteria bacterium]|nr:hypothetical protein [Deltaproteobacteria bacterium]